ncbi:wax ester/triacylglycerol synthase family O-acyltransferase [Curvibacter gracilis]|uniref:wax ester/triacylglycerol synthase family O-acyltransferase n=1 Tax=Curvibacter gracilis TaxID=230310 RepID=UPI0004BA846A|nr:wax ester/triacylglycerol synthase family O-acyltransferase [Curvibacter gracilis]
MDHLSGLDATFLHVESPETPMHVASLHVLDLPEGYQGDYCEDVRHHLQERQHLADLLTRRLALMPFDLSDPVWVRDDDIDWDYHVRPITLPSPGSNAQLQALVARLHSSLLDRSRPLWEVAVITGLKSGQVALYLKVHHCGIDGQSGVALGNALFDRVASGRVVPAPLPRPPARQRDLGVAELAAAALKNTGRQYLKLLRMTPSMARAAKTVLLPAPGEDGKRSWRLPKNLQLLAPRTPFNVTITNQRSFAARTVPLAEVKYVAKHLGGSVNDVVMATTSGALRRYLTELGCLPEKSLTAAVPVSLRTPGDSRANNQVSMMVVPLCTQEGDRAQRFHAIHDAAQANKGVMGQIKAAIPTDYPIFAAPWLISGLNTMLARSKLINQLPPMANVVISNVAGIQEALYCAGARVVCYYPLSIPTHGMALNVTVQSYNGRVDYGLIACRQAVPQIHELADFVLEEHQQLLALARQAEAHGGKPAAAAAPGQTTGPTTGARKSASTASSGQTQSLAQGTTPGSSPTPARATARPRPAAARRTTATADKPTAPSAKTTPASRSARPAAKRSSPEGSATQAAPGTAPTKRPARPRSRTAAAAKAAPTTATTSPGANQAGADSGATSTATTASTGAAAATA